jgi:hypothetical protein
MATTPNSRGAVEHTSPDESDRLLARSTALQAASRFCAGKCVAGIDVKSTDVLKIAEAFARWLQGEPPIG